MPNDEGFTGSYASGSDTVILRLSETANLSEETKGLTPSVAIKFIVNEFRSNNIFAMNSFKANEGSWNFFEKKMMNRVPPFTPEDDPIEFATMHKKIIDGSKCPYGTAIAHVASIGNDGKYVEPLVPVKTPYELEFESPDLKLALDDPALAGEMWYRQL